jgi:transcriptional regulator with PAS, ATPase and Fis domain
LHIPFELESLVEVHDQPFAIIDAQQRILVVNRAYAEAFGVTRAEAVARPCYDLLCGEGRACPCGPQGRTCPFAAVFAGEATRFASHDHCDTEGRGHRLRIQAYPLHTGSGEVYVGELIQRDATRHHPGPGDADGAASGLVGSAPAFQAALCQLRVAAGSDAPVLLQGDTGTGKELAAAFIHCHSGRRRGPFLTLDCTALTQALFESEVFGHERGVFTGSAGEKRGLYELADKGTLFLDEIGDMPLPLQAKLLRVIENGEFRRLGGTRTHRSDVRIVCATNRELRDAPWFRSDLYYRVACLTIRLPSLAERRSDIPALASALLGRIVHSSGQALWIDEAALRRLQGYDYPGNVRELRNVLWVAAVNSEDGCITAAHVRDALPVQSPALGDEPLVALPPGPAEEEQTSVTQGVTAGLALDAEHLATLLRRHLGNRRLVAQELGVSERTIYRKLRQFGLD